MRFGNIDYATSVQTNVPTRPILVTSFPLIKNENDVIYIGRALLAVPAVLAEFLCIGRVYDRYFIKIWTDIGSRETEE